MTADYEIVKRLREPKQWQYYNGYALNFESKAPFEAADAIERLTKERDAAERASGIFEKDVVRLIGERDAAIARAEACETEENVRWVKAIQERDALRALLREALAHIQDRHGFTFHDLRARIAAATGVDNG